MFKKYISNPFFIFPLLTCIFFWPVSLQFFTFKNDALTYYYPIRTLISDALNNHELPLWTPFINMGYPLHADMQSGAWNPVIWIIGYITNYSLATFHYEVIFYLAFGGIGFYYLGREYRWNRSTSFLIGLAYEFSGPITDSIQFTTCISSACYIPFIFLFFNRVLNQKKTILNALLTAFFLYLLFTGGYPAFFIIVVYLLLVFLLFAFFSSEKKIEFLKKMLLPFCILGLIFLLLSLPAIISFANHLQFINRGKKQDLNFILENSMPPGSFFSLLSPFSTTAEAAFLNTDILMRSIFLGIVPLIFLVYTLMSTLLRKNRQQVFFFITALILFGLALGSHFFLRQLAYYLLPLMDTFRHPALFRFFGVIFLLLTAGFTINNYNATSTLQLRRITVMIAVIVLLISSGILLLYHGELIPGNFSASHLKTILYSLKFQQRFLIQTPFILTTLGILYYLLSRKNGIISILLLSVTDLFFATQLTLPVTVIGARTFVESESLINRNMVLFPLPANQSIELNSKSSIDSTATIKSVLPFEKRIGRNDYYITPGNLSSQEYFYKSSIKEAVFKNKVVYFADTVVYRSNKSTDDIKTTAFAIIDTSVIFSAGLANSDDTVAINEISANLFEGTAVLGNSRVLVFLQNIYPGWKAYIDKREIPIFTVNTCFIGIQVPSGSHQLVFRYRPTLIINAWYVSCLTLVILTLWLMWFNFSKGILFKHHQKGNSNRETKYFQ